MISSFETLELNVTLYPFTYTISSKVYVSIYELITKAPIISVLIEVNKSLLYVVALFKTVI